MFAPDLPLKTARLVLRSFVRSDIEVLLDLQSRPEVVRYMPWGARDRDEVTAVLEDRLSHHALREEGERITLAVTLAAGGALIGDVVLKWISEAHRQGEIGFSFLPEHQGRGYATEAVGPVLEMGFGGLGLHRIVGHCDPRNGPSVRLMERLGMRREAHLRENECFKGEWADELIYAMLASEWRARPTRREETT